MHKHITRDERAVISDGYRRGESYRMIGDRIGKSGSTVFREIVRNCDKNERYVVAGAHHRARRRREKAKRGERRIENDGKLRERIESELHPLVSPETIAHQEGIHFQTIYSWIDRSRPDLKEKLAQRGKRRRKYGSNRERLPTWTAWIRPIHERPSAPVSWEGDTIRGSTRSGLLTHVERKSLFTVIDLLDEGTAVEVHTKTVSRGFRGLLTYDRGGEFSYWDMMEKDLDVKVYFADPHSPWQRGKNENTNGRIRRVFPKRFNFSTITQREAEEVAWKMNHTPRKSLLWRTPCAVYGRCCNSA